jgi:uncharacterized protein YvpB
VKTCGQHVSPFRSKSVKALEAAIMILIGVLIQPFSIAYASNKGKVIKAPIIRQFPELPTGCEATSTAMLLRWAGVNVSKQEIAKSIPRGRVPVRKRGRIYGDNPNKVFVGSPFSKTGYGVYHKPVTNVINKYLPGRAQDLTGTSFDNVLKVIDSKRPVIVWCTIANLHPNVTITWYDNNGNKVVWRTPQHAVLLVGYDESYVIVNDPWKGKICRYPISSFKKHWEVMGRQAVTIK